MTGPLVVLGGLSLLGGWLNLPEFLPVGPVQMMHHWLEPVTGAAALRITKGAEALEPASTEYLLVGIAVAIAIAGIAIAYARLKPAAVVSKAQSAEPEGFERLLEHKYFVDEAYDRAIIQPLVSGSRAVLWKGMDSGIIDGLFVNGSAYLARGVGWLGARLQSGRVGTYAWVLVIGVIAVLSAFSLR